MVWVNEKLNKTQITTVVFLRLVFLLFTLFPLPSTLVVAELKPLRQLHFKSLSEVQRLQDSDRTTSPSTEESPDNNWKDKE